MNINILDIVVRKSVLKDIKGMENVSRKMASVKDYEVFNDRIYPYVYSELLSQLGESTVNQMPVVSQLNIAKRIVKSEATIYTNDPKRVVEGAKESDQKAIDSLYKDCAFNSKLQKSNIWFKYRGQSFIQVVPKEKKLQLRVLQGHHVDVIPDTEDPEKPYCYIISSFDKSSVVTGSDGRNQLIGDTDDFRTKERYLWITSDVDFVTDGNGDLLSEVRMNSIGELPIVEVSKDKDFEFFIRIGQALSDFTILYNVSWSDQLYTKRFQGFSIGTIQGDKDLLPESMTIGPAKLLFLPVNKDNPNSKLDLSFQTPDAKLEESLKVIRDLLADFLMSRGVDQSKISSALSGQKTYGSAIERLLAMIDEFEATREDFDLFEQVEKKLFNIVKKYLVLLTGNIDLLDKKFWVSKNLESQELNVTFHKPEMIETYSEKLANAQAKITLGIADRVSVLMELENLSEEEANKKIQEINQRKQDEIKAMVKNVQGQAQPNDNGVGSQPNDKPQESNRL